MRVFKLIISEKTIPCMTLLVKFIDQGKTWVGLVMYLPNKKQVSKHFLINEAHGILVPPPCGKDQVDIDWTKVNTAEEFFDIFLKNFDDAQLNARILDTAIETGFEFTEEELRELISVLGIDEEFKYEHTKIIP